MSSIVLRPNPPRSPVIQTDRDYPILPQTYLTPLDKSTQLQAPESCFSVSCRVHPPCQRLGNNIHMLKLEEKRGGEKKKVGLNGSNQMLTSRSPISSNTAE
jgi:hypothetical protein